MDSIDPAGELAAARQQLVKIWEDPRIKSLARWHAGDPQVADDALQNTYIAMARLKHLDQIENLRAYFCRVLVREVHRERGQLGALLVADFARTTEESEAASDSRGESATAFEDAVCTSVQAWSWHRRLIGAHDELMAAVPARSDDPARYRTVIYAAAEQILRDGINGDASEADTNDALRVSYPEYFDQPGASRSACHQRFSRARTDVRELLRAVVN